MADLFNRLFSRLGSYNDELDYEEESEQDTYIETKADPGEDYKAAPSRRQASKVVDIKPHPANQSVVIMQPSDIEAAQQACDHIRAGKTVICNIEKVDPRVAQRVIDFITGSAYALDGKVMPVSSVIFVVAPRNTALVEGNLTGQHMDYLKQAYATR
jgi:cell division inhibitor SepF